MNRSCKEASRGTGKVTLKAEPTGESLGPDKFDGRENLGTISTTAAGKKPTTSTGKPRTATRLT